MYKFLLLIIVFSIMSCSFKQTTNNYTPNLQSWIGRNENQLYPVWGYPTHVFYISPTEKILTYITTSAVASENVYQRELYYQGLDQANWFERLFEPRGMWEQPKIYYCKTSFIIKNYRIVGYNFNGDDCVTNNN